MDTYTRTKRKRTTNCNKCAQINHPRLLLFWFSHMLLHQWFPDLSAAITCVWHLHDSIYVSSLWALSSPQLPQTCKKTNPETKVEIYKRANEDNNMTTFSFRQEIFVGYITKEMKAGICLFPALNISAD